MFGKQLVETNGKTYEIKKIQKTCWYSETLIETPSNWQILGLMKTVLTL